MNELSNEEYDKLVKLHEELKHRRAGVEGAIAEQTKRLRKEFGCRTTDEAMVKMKRLAKKARVNGKIAKKEYDRLMKIYKRRLK